jgi:hypothetical protein
MFDRLEQNLRRNATPNLADVSSSSRTTRRRQRAGISNHPGRDRPRPLDAGDGPGRLRAVRVAVAPDRRVVWVTARGSNRLLGFAAARLAGRDPGHTLEADVFVGEAPIGLTPGRPGELVIVADSDRSTPRTSTPP